MMQRLAAGITETIDRWEKENLSALVRILDRGGSVELVTYPTGKQKIRAVYAPCCSLPSQSLPSQKEEYMPEVSPSTYLRFRSA